MHYLIGVGSNKGDRSAYVRQAQQALLAATAGKLIASAPLYENPACGGPCGQGDFLNGAWLLETAYGPHQLLHHLQRVEHQLGRVRTIDSGPRTIDLDILFCDEMPIIINCVLELPHPRLHQRRFVLEPLNAIAPEWIHPILGTQIKDLFQDLLNAHEY